MKSANKFGWIVVGAVAALAVMGLACCWGCPDRLQVGSGRYWFRQLAWNAVGVAACSCAAMVGWKSWLKAAPFVAAGWVSFLAGPVFFGWSVNGCPAVTVGPLHLFVFDFLPFAAAMLLAWIAAKWKLRAIPLVACFVLLATGVAAAVLLTPPDRIADLKLLMFGEAPQPPEACAKFYAVEYVQEWMRNAFGTAKWFTPGDVSGLGYLPGAATHGMPATAAVMFGKWVLVLGGLLFGVVAAAMAWFSCSTKDETKKAWTIVAGLGIVVPAAWGVCECLGLVPLRYTSVPLVAYGGSMTLVSWLTAGVFLSLAGGEE